MSSCKQISIWRTFFGSSRNNFPHRRNRKIRWPSAASRRRGLPSYSRTTRLCATVKNLNALFCYSPFKLRVEARGAFLFSVIAVLFAAPHDVTGAVFRCLQALANLCRGRPFRSRRRGYLVGAYLVLMVATVIVFRFWIG